MRAFPTCRRRRLRMVISALIGNAERLNVPRSKAVVQIQRKIRSQLKPVMSAYDFDECMAEARKLIKELQK